MFTRARSVDLHIEPQRSQRLAGSSIAGWNHFRPSPLDHLGQRVQTVARNAVVRITPCMVETLPSLIDPTSFLRTSSHAAKLGN